MKYFILLVVSAVVVAAKPTTILTPIISSISSQYHAQDALGQYSYGYNNELSAKTETRSSDGTTRGGYSYIDAEGKLQSIEYIADPVNGFRAIGTNIPRSAQPLHFQQSIQIADTPEVVEARANHLAAFEEAKLRAANPSFASQIIQLPSGAIFQHVPATVAFRTNFIPAANSIAVSQFFPGFSYSYGIQGGISSQPIITPYTAPLIVSDTSAATNIPSAPADTPEVAKAKTEHLEAVEKETFQQEQQQ